MARAQKQAEGLPDLVLKLPGHQLQQPSGDAAEHDKALARLPGLLDRLKMLLVGCFEGGILFGFA